MDEPAVYGPSDFLAADGKSTSDLKSTYVASLNGVFVYQPWIIPFLNVVDDIIYVDTSEVRMIYCPPGQYYGRLRTFSV